MNNLNALGFFIDYCNRNAWQENITRDRFQRGIQEILHSPEGRFENCRCAQDILRELGWI